MMTLQYALRNTLIEVGPGGALQPELATEWAGNADSTVWTFKLRPDVKFHDGSTFNAQAVVWNLDKLLNSQAEQFDPKQAAPGRNRIPTVKAYKVIDELTVETVYEVLGGEDPSAQVILSAGPQSGDVGASTRFHWRGLPNAVIYQLQVFQSDREQSADPAVLGESPSFVAGMLLPAGTTETSLPPLVRGKLEPGRFYLWRITAHDQAGTLIGRSREWRVRYQP